MTIENYAKYVIADTYTVTLSATSLSTTSNSSLTINSGGTFAAENLTSMSDFTLTNSGTWMVSSLISMTDSSVTLHSSQSFPSLTTLTGTTFVNNATLNFPSLTTFDDNTITNNGVYNQSSSFGSTLTIPSGCIWYENGTNAQIGTTNRLRILLLMEPWNSRIRIRQVLLLLSRALLFMVAEN